MDYNESMSKAQSVDYWIATAHWVNSHLFYNDYLTREQFFSAQHEVYRLAKAIAW